MTSSVSRDALADLAMQSAVQGARIMYGLLRQEQIKAKYETPDVDSNYYYRQYQIVSKKLASTSVALRKLRKNLSGWQTNQAQGCDKYANEIDDILNGIGA
jgi:hypothetical protein